ncbi:DUF58 domain-containing protein [Zoogloea sp.]|uniref:DUF58 domain-containing protein n=1 Tax=Zoogloea sp. TaxID=49181 RepID=UPI0025F76B09|nr:DUF58 domain-containing protein [Zoogloea sp.]MCK6393715.1 DUF58 domain-containing protein [Zoogloea sp.]
MDLPALRAALHRWLFRVSGPEPAPIQLGQRRIFVLPTRFGLAFALTLLVMLLASINYTLSLGFALTFLIGSVAWVSIHHAFRNLVGLSVTPGKAEAVFCGSPARFGIILNNPALRPRQGLHLASSRASEALHSAAPFDIEACSSTVQDIHLATHHRGWLPLPRLTLETRYPLGLIRAWSLFQPDVRCLVYPTPEADGPPLPVGRDTDSGLGGRGSGQDDFAGLRHHQPADSPRHVAWKAVARGGPWRTKEFDGAGARDVQLDWKRMPAGMGIEARLARLTRWVMEADRAGIDFGLSLPGAEIPPGRGQAHRHACLTRLALFGLHDD